MPAKTELFVRKQAGGVFTISRQDLTTGGIFFVDSATGVNSVSHGVNPDAPLASLAYTGLTATGILTASKGDRVYVMPGHSEACIAAGTINLQVAGVEYFGIGTGAARPTINFTTDALASLIVSGAGVRLKNFIFDLTGVDAVTGGISVTGEDVTIEDSLILMADAGGQAVVGVTIGAAAHRFTLRNCLILCPNAGATQAVYCAGGPTDVRIEGNYFDGSATTAMIFNDTALMARLRVINNYFRCSGATGVGLSVHANTTGFVNGNHSFVTANIAVNGSMTAAAMSIGLNYASENAHVGASATLDPTAGGFA